MIRQLKLTFKIAYFAVTTFMVLLNGVIWTFNSRNNLLLDKMWGSATMNKQHHIKNNDVLSHDCWSLRCVLLWAFCTSVHWHVHTTTFETLPTISRQTFWTNVTAMRDQFEIWFNRCQHQTNSVHTMPPAKHFLARRSEAKIYEFKIEWILLHCKLY